MHEFSIAAQLVKGILEFAAKRRAGRIVKVHLELGELACVESEQLRLCFESISRESPLEGAALEIEPVTAEVCCAHCGYTGPPKYWLGALSFGAIATLECPRCSKAAEARRGQECVMKSIQFVRATAGAAAPR